MGDLFDYQLNICMLDILYLVWIGAEVMAGRYRHQIPLVTLQTNNT
jgi:hypothetical protein